MSNFDTITAITDNLQSVLEKIGLTFDVKTFEDVGNVPWSKFPCGQIIYVGEDFEFTHNERAKYADAVFTVLVYLSERDPKKMTRSLQDYAHKVREALTAPALNIGALAATKYISVVDVGSVRAETSNAEGVSVLRYEITTRYREQ